MKLSLARDVTLTPIETGAVLLDGRHGRYWKLNGSGAAVLRGLLDGDAPEAVAAGLTAGTEVADDEACRDVWALIEALSSARLVEVGS
ncbi:lasso peptide biosynthesis PqqD family chaperone [Kitasatospora acidiphila]|uniref:Lasso peptide biosynthesis PqqD family chaperone n=1 Tax=Kitasatospora acidiphila TaxID=2567942 RepID=A0A540W7C6_9ACTN|nr:lasso peptide biosynthesis PqqD family chaperone [Kitasatospora acidiphila]TQF04922.1 lasso peptide biosynthesis PqqD family chaperone [Kitasatospora acidiphila]